MYLQNPENMRLNCLCLLLIAGLLFACTRQNSQYSESDQTSEDAELSEEIETEVDATDTDIWSPPSANTPSSSACSDISARDLQTEMLKQVNALRAEGCKCGDQVFPPTHALRWNRQLQQAAERHSRDMAENSNMSHTGSNGSTLPERVLAEHYNYGAVAENVAWNQRSISQVIESWKNSPGHCRNMMGSEYTEMGAAVHECYWTQVFGAVLQ